MQSLMNEAFGMTSMTIRNIDEGLKTRLRVRAASHGHSMEEEARDILRAALSTETKKPHNLFEAIRARIAPLGGVELEIPPREPMPPPVEFD
jgi:plasmid stability protein